MTSSEQDLRQRVAAHDWWHTIELAPGVVTPGGWDLRPTAERLPWPGSLAGLRCLDVGTMDGFWAFEMERRRAASVHAIDLVDPARQDAPYDGTSSGIPRHRPTCAARPSERPPSCSARRSSTTT